MTYVQKIIDEPATCLGHALGFNKLTSVHDDWIKFCWHGENLSILQAHRNSYKTTAILVVGTIYYLMFNPDESVIIVRKTDTQAQKILKTITKVYKSAEFRFLYKKLFDKDFKLTQYNSKEFAYPERIKISADPSGVAIGIGADNTGSHASRIIADDIVTLRDRYSAAERKTTINYFQELKNILKPGGKLALVGTPWHSQDLFSFLQEREYEIKKFPLSSISIDELTKQRIEDIKNSMSLSLFEANYNLRHISDEDRLLKKAEYTKWNPEDSYVYAAIDPAWQGKDTTALSMFYKFDNKLIVRGYVFQKSIVNIMNRIAKILKSHSVSKVIVENNKDEGAIERELSNQNINAIGIKNYINKLIRINTHVVANWKDVLIADDCQENFLVQLLDYVEGEEPDDAIDSLALAFEHCLHKNNVQNYFSEQFGTDFKF